jgi:uncharacterized protein (TIGR03066 family)
MTPALIEKAEHRGPRRVHKGDVMRTLRLVGIAFLVLCLAACSGKDKKDSDKQSNNAEKIIGKWVLTKAPKGAPLGTIFEFSKDGKVNWLDGEGAEPIPGTYKIDGDKLTLTLPSPEDGKPKSETSTIKTLTDTTLVTIEKDQEMKDVELEFKKK